MIGRYHTEGKEEYQLQDDVSGPAELLPCYEFNVRLSISMDDGTCGHCRKFLTMECDNIEDFIDEEEWEDE